MEHFVAGVTARTAAELADVNRNTATKLNFIIGANLTSVPGLGNDLTLAKNTYNALFQQLKPEQIN